MVLYNKNMQGNVFNSNLYPSEIYIGDNVIFIGTINTDETTFSFSDKVLDRSFVIELDEVNYKEWKNRVNYIEDSNLKREPFDSRKFKSFINNDIKVELSSEELDLFNELNGMLKEINSATGIGYRILSQINKYIKNLPKQDEINRGKAVDYQILQKVMPKLRGSVEVLEKLIGEEGVIYIILDKYKNISDFEKTTKALKQKNKEMLEHGFVA